jgi:hypothetical protein
LGNAGHRLEGDRDRHGDFGTLLHGFSNQGFSGPAARGDRTFFCK